MIIYNGISIEEISIAVDPDGDSLLVVRVVDIQQPKRNDPIIIRGDTFTVVDVYAKAGHWYLNISGEEKDEYHNDDNGDSESS